MNDGIDPDKFSLQFIKFGYKIYYGYETCSGCVNAKFDVQSAYRNVAMLPHRWHLFGMGKFYIDLALPFGLLSAPFIFIQ